VAAASALARRTLAASRIRTAAFAYLFGILAWVNVAGYKSTYPTVADRLGFAHSFGDNKAIRLFYGEPHDLLTVGGYAAWRVGGTAVLFAAAWALLGGIRPLRGEEDAGRMELVLSGIVSRRGVYAATLVALAAGAAVLAAAEIAGLVAGGLPVGGSAYLGLATISVVPVFAGVGALASQLAPTQRGALRLASAVALLAFVLRVLADTSSGAAWVRWLTPFGWAEELRPFAGPRPAVLVLPLVTGAVLLGVAGRVAARRDVGTGLLRDADSGEPNPRLLSSPTALALRGELWTIVAWIAGIGFFGFVLGVVSNGVSSAGISKSLQEQLARLGAGSILTPAGYLGFTFLFFVLAISLFACSQIGAARREEAEGRLETLFSLPLPRTRWLGGRLLLAGAAIAAISLAAGLFTWAGAAGQGVHVSLAKMVEAGANCAPVPLLFLGVGALVYALAPRATTGVTYGLVVATYLWQVFGSLLGAPVWLLDLSPFRHVGLVPAQPFEAGGAAIMVAIGALAAIAALRVFRRRDLTGH
jgi:ABC-2 type transport system permease protein